MKKLLFSALIAVSIVSSAFAADVNKVNVRILNSFRGEYAGVSQVEWVSKAQFVKASFMVDNKKVEAFYSHDGERIGTASNITLEDLPTSAKRIFAKKYAGYTVKEAIEFNSDQEQAYFLTAVNEKESVILKIKDGFIRAVRK
jgi:hypothetical protein